MAGKQLNLEEAAAYLDIGAMELSRLVRQGEMPYAGDPAHPLFLADELDSWASRRILAMNAKRLDALERGIAASHPKEAPFSLLSLLALERVFIGIEARTKASMLSGLVDCADSLGLLYDPKDLLESLRRREEEGSTALQGGVAIPHPRHHDPYLASESFLIVARPAQPIHFGAADGKPSDLFFLLVCQEERLHLRALARLCSKLQDSAICARLRAAEDAEGILAALGN